MLLNYHEMTMNEPRDSPARRRQFLVVCVIMATAFVHSALSAGLFSRVEISQGHFPGGDFVYKYTLRDYAASWSLKEHIGSDLGIKPREFSDKIYALYLDNPNDVGGRQQRFACGYLANNKEGRETKKILLQKNKLIKPASKSETAELGALALWPKLAYEQSTLPRVKAAIAHFPYTNGFVSAIIHSWKVIPALRKYVQEHSSKQSAVTVLSTCSVKDQMCTWYAPLEQGKKFLLNKPDSETYRRDLLDNEQVVSFSWKRVGRMTKRVFPPLSLIFKETKTNYEL